MPVCSKFEFCFMEISDVLFKKIIFPTCSLLIHQCGTHSYGGQLFVNSFLSTDCNIYCIFYSSDYHIYGLRCGLLILSKKNSCFSVTKPTAQLWQQMSSSPRAISQLATSEAPERITGRAAHLVTLPGRCRVALSAS